MLALIRTSTSIQLVSVGTLMALAWVGWGWNAEEGAKPFATAC